LALAITIFSSFKVSLVSITSFFTCKYKIYTYKSNKDYREQLKIIFLEKTRCGGNTNYS